MKMYLLKKESGLKTQREHIKTVILTFKKLYLVNKILPFLWSLTALGEL